jgi:D-3-phosphoglycerate dehydrogenase
VDLISSCKNLKVISTPSTGSTNINRIDFEVNSNVVINTLRNKPGLELITASSEWTFFLIMNSFRKAKMIEKSIRSGYWRETEDNLRGNQLSGKTLGIIGFGRIGKNIARYANAFNMSVIAYDINKVDYPNYVKQSESIEDVASKCDVFCVCVHYDKNTEMLIDSDIIRKFKRDVIVVNSSRGEIVDEPFLLEQLKLNNIKYLSVDVLSKEVEYSNSELFKSRNEFDNLYVSPHIAGLSFESEYLAFDISLLGLIKFENNAS